MVTQRFHYEWCIEKKNRSVKEESRIASRMLIARKLESTTKVFHHKNCWKDYRKTNWRPFGNNDCSDQHPVQYLGNVLDWMLITAVIVGTLYAIHICITTIQVIGTFLGIVKHVVTGSWKGLCFIVQTCYTKRCRKKVSDYTTILVLFGLIATTLGCNEIASIQATEKVCTRMGREEKCVLNTAAILNIRPNGSVACFRVRDEQKMLETFVEVQVDTIVSTCMQKTHHFTRDFKIEHSWAHRCWKAGSCEDEVCEELKHNETVPEFSSESRNAPGYSRCYRTCGCITCGMCFHCTPSCIFSRLFATPRSHEVYEVLTCPAWTSTVEVRININGNQTKHRIDHGVPFTIPSSNITVIITGFSTPPAPVHGATFVKRCQDTHLKEEYGYAYTSVAQAGVLIRGLIGEFQCATYQQAKNFKCLFDERLCQCFNQGTTLTCSCNHIKMEELIRKTLLPRTETGIQLLAEEGKILTKTTSSALIGVQVQFKNQTIERIVKEDECILTEVSITGCFSCGRGMKLYATCHSKINEVIEATIRCPTLGLEFISCSTKGNEEVVRYHTEQREVNEGCTVQCGRNLSTVEIKGQLDEEATFIEETVKETFATFSEFVVFEGPLDFIKNTAQQWWSSLTSWVGKWIVIGGLVVIFIVMLSILGPIAMVSIGGPFAALGRPECRGRTTKPRVRKRPSRQLQ